jgi:tetratricopeptide (TPR) repeat protein
MDKDELKEKFPNLKPLSGAPPLFRVNGCGVSLVGRRDYDKETRTYVKTYCIFLIFIPVIPICAYRVSDASGGWYFIGREPLSGLMKAWNMLLLLAVAGGLGFSAWQAHIESPEYRAGQMMHRAADAESAGNFVSAAGTYVTIANGNTSHATQARENFQKLVVAQVGSIPPADFVLLVSSVPSIRLGSSETSKIYELAMTRIKGLMESQPRDALKMADAIRPLSSKPAEFAPFRESILERIIAKDPKDVGAASELAILYEGRKQPEKCRELLEPVADKLGSTEGARILGEIYAREDKTEEAFKLLSPYAEGRLNVLHDAEKAYGIAIQNCQNSSLAGLRAGRGPASFYSEYDRLSKDKQQALVDNYLENDIKNSADVKNKQEALVKAAEIVPVALDLGIVRLRRAQAMSDAGERRKELEAAEKLFLAIRGVAGQTDEYRLFYGQVSYWLGKHDEGKKLFDELLASKQRSDQILLSVASVMREVGGETDARALVEEAYNKTPDQNKKYQAAGIRAAMHTDLDDDIKWLKLANPEEPYTAADLNHALGEKAIRDGDKPGAANFLRKSMGQFAALPKTTVSLNNGALASFTLFQVTRERADFQKGLEMMEGALALSPSDSVLLHNISYNLIQDALIGVIGDEIDLKALDLDAGTHLLSMLYVDEASREKCMQRLASQPSYARAMAILNRLLVLSPRKPDIYQGLLRMYSMTRDLEKIKELQKRLTGIPLDQENNVRQLESYTTKRDAQDQQEMDVYRKKLEKLVVDLKENKKAFPIAADHLSESLIGDHVFGRASDYNRAVSLAEQAHAAAATPYTRSQLIEALHARASEAMAKGDTEYSALETKYRRTMSPTNLLAWHLLKEGKRRDTILQNADVQRSLELLKEDGRLLPKHRDAWKWVFLNAADPAEAARIAEQIKSDLSRCIRELDLVLYPVNSSVALNAYFARIAENDEPGGRKILDEFIARGTPLPGK